MESPLKVLHTADWHLRGKDLEVQQRCLESLIETAETEQPGLIVHAGDVFDRRDAQMDSRAAKLAFETFSRLANIAPVIIDIGTPSHEGTATEVLRHVKGKYPVEVITYPTQLLLVDGKFVDTIPENYKDCVDAVLTVIPAPTKQFFASDSDIKGTDSEIAQAMTSMLAGFGASAEPYRAEGVPHIGVGHWNITGSLISETQTLTGVDIELSRDQMALANVDLWCMGHIHKAQKIGEKWALVFKIVPGGFNIYFSGSTTSLTWGEMDPKGFFVHDFGRLESRFVLTPDRRRLRIDIDTTGGWDDWETMFYAYGPDEIENATIQVTVKCWADEAGQITKEEIESAFPVAESITVDIVRIPRANVRAEKLLEEESLRGRVQYRAELAGETVPESILEKCDRLEREPAETLVRKSDESNSDIPETSEGRRQKAA